MLLKNISYVPKSNSIWISLNLPTFPKFKNYDTTQMKSFNFEHFAKRVIMVKALIVRREESDNNLSDLFEIRGGVQFSDIATPDQKLINEYVETCASNLIFLQTLIDTISSDKNNLEKTRILSSILGYGSDEKISLLRKNVLRDYKSLQWN
jgi:hypothetical protein